MSNLREVFPNLSKQIFEDQTEKFREKMKYLNVLSGDLNKYREQFPEIPEPILRSYYLEYLDRLDLLRMESIKIFSHLDDIPIKVIIRIFRYCEFPDLIRFAMTNSVLYRYVTGFSFVRQRLEWEREHHAYINHCIYHRRYSDLVYHCPNSIEQTYKNQVILKRNLHRINPPEGHSLASYNTFTVFQYYFLRKYFYLFQNKHRHRMAPQIAMDCFALLNEREMVKYEHAAAVARRYGFILCFRTVSWTYDKELPYLDFCHETALQQKLRDLIAEQHKDIIEPISPVIKRTNKLTFKRRDKQYDNTEKGARGREKSK